MSARRMLSVLLLVNSVVPARDRDKPVREPVREPPRVYAPPEAPPQILAASAENGATPIEMEFVVWIMPTLQCGVTHHITFTTEAQMLERDWQLQLEREAAAMAAAQRRIGLGVVILCVLIGLNMPLQWLDFCCT